MQAKKPANRPCSRRVTENTAATKRHVAKIIGAIALFLLSLVCASLMNEVIHDLWEMTIPIRQELLNWIIDIL